MTEATSCRAAPGAGRRTRRTWLAPEMVQTSSMDCGPAALKCLLDGHGIPAHYGRLREACQTSVDGTSIDTLEDVAQQLGLQAEQVMVPVDHVARRGAADLPAIAVVQHADLGAHFIVVWRRVGHWVQVMDPAVGRRWLSVKQLRARLFRHEMVVPADAWRDHAGTDENRDALRGQGRQLGLSDGDATAMFDHAAADPQWVGLATLEAATRLTSALQAAGGVDRGAEATRLVRTLCAQCEAEPSQRQQIVPAAYWSVSPQVAHTGSEDSAGDAQAGSPDLALRGAVMLRIHGRRVTTGASTPDALPQELSAVLRERAEPVWQAVWRLLCQAGRAAPLAMAAAALGTTVLAALQLLLLRGLVDLAEPLTGAGQRLGAAGALLAFLALLPALEWATLRESMRLGRQLELRLRATLLEQLPRLHDRYFQSRPISDMADRAHGIQIARSVPGVALGLWQAGLDLALTLAGLLWLAPASAAWSVAMAVAAVAVPLSVLPLLGERDLRVRTHAAALSGFYLDALLGLVPVRAHRAERTVRREHEALLVEWARALQGWVAGAQAAQALQGLLGLGLLAGFMTSHFSAQQSVLGSDLLLVFWALRVAGLGQRVAHLSQQLPAQRNALSRLMEPLSAETTSAPEASTGPAVAGGALALRIERGQVVAGGHRILTDIDMAVAAGEHVAIVGRSGAGKSSLVGLLLGWHRLAEGSLHLEGRAWPAHDPLTAAKVEGLRRHVAWVDPAVQLWNRSLRDNLLYAGGEEAAGRLDSALDLAGLHEVVARLPEGLRALLGEGGGLLSGGEGQRVRLARALLQEQPRLVLLDEPFRGLDRPRREALLAEARTWWHDRTLLCVTHDVGETLQFPRVLVVEDGRIVEDGVPARLAEGPSRYRELLQAENLLRERLWGDPVWRRLVLQDGRLVAAAGASR